MKSPYEQLIYRKEKAIKRRREASAEIARGLNYVGENYGEIVADAIDRRFPDNVIARLISNSIRSGHRNIRKNEERTSNHQSNSSSFMPYLKQGFSLLSPYLLSFGLGFLKRKIRRKFRRK